MLSYRHSFHSGNHADIFKHASLIQLITAMKRKPKPIFYLETHGGAGVYDLRMPMSQKVKEYETGVTQVWLDEAPPACIAPYADLLHKMNKDATLDMCPGSPWVAKQCLDRNDRAFIHELHKSDFAILNDLMRPFKSIKTFNQDGLSAIKATLPPPERRGLIFIDPSYEIKTEYEAVYNAVVEGYKKFETGVFAIWYPLLKSGAQLPLTDALMKADFNNTVNITYKIKAGKDVGMYGSGLFIINAPYQTEDLIRQIGKYCSNLQMP